MTTPMTTGTDADPNKNKKMNDIILSYISYITSTHFASGAAGAVVRYATSKDKKLKENIAGGIAGALTASYVTPLITSILSIDESSRSASGIAFVLGLIGLYLTEALVRIIGNYSKNPVIPTAISLEGIATAINVSAELSNINNNKQDNDDDNNRTDGKSAQ